MTPRTSISALEGAKSGDREATERLFAPLADYALQVARKILTSRGIDVSYADDAAQSALLGVMVAVRDGKYDPSRGRFHTWVYACVLNACRDILGRRTDGVQLGDEDVPGPDSQTQEDRELTAWGTAAVLVALRRIREDARNDDASMTRYQAFQLCVLREMTSENAGKLIGMSAAAVRMAVSRMRRKALVEALEVLETVGLDEEDDKQARAVVVLSLDHTGVPIERLIAEVPEDEQDRDSDVLREVDRMFRRVESYLRDEQYVRSSRACLTSVASRG